MKSIRLFLIFTAFGLSLTSCHNLIVGNGSIIEKKSFLDTTTELNFTEIVVNCDCNVYLNQDNYTEVKLQGYENLVPHVNANIAGNTCIIELTPDYVFDNNNIYVYITTPSYTKISLTSQSSITSTDSIIGEHLEVVNSSSGTISLFGDMSTVIASSGGPGITRLCSLSADTITAVMLGSGVLSTKPLNHLNAQVQGSGQIQYIGSPNLNFSITGTGSLLQALGCY